MVLRTLSTATIGLVAGLSLSSCEPLPNRSNVAQQVTQSKESLFAHNWTWTDEQGKAVTFSRWSGSPIVVAAVYTTCTRTCPLTVEKLRAVYETYQRAGRNAQFVLVTLDPNEDTPERLRQFKKSRNLPEGWHLLTGGRNETLEVMDLLGIHVLDMDSHVFHDTRIAVFDERGLSSRNFACCDFDDSAALL